MNDCSDRKVQKIKAEIETNWIHWNLLPLCFKATVVDKHYERMMERPKFYFSLYYYESCDRSWKMFQETSSLEQFLLFSGKIFSLLSRSSLKRKSCACLDIIHYVQVYCLSGNWRMLDWKMLNLEGSLRFSEERFSIEIKGLLFFIGLVDMSLKIIVKKISMFKKRNRQIFQHWI